MIWIHLTSGYGPPECEQFVHLLCPVIEQEAIKNNLNSILIDFEPSNSGLLSGLISIEGQDETNFANSFAGNIEWICKSSIRPHHRRKRWFIRSSILHLVPPPDVVISESDLKWETVKSSGPGGQHVNKTESAVRLTHSLTGITVTAQEERSQFRNKSLAKAKLLEKLENHKSTQLLSQKTDVWSRHSDLERGNPIRTYEGLPLKQK